MRKEICISGFGGQGVVLAGYIVGKAAALYDNYEAVMTQAYGPEARGGASSTNIVISDEPIDYPFVRHPDILVALSQEAFTKFHPRAKPDATILIDSDLVTTDPDTKLFSIPATALAKELGHRLVANVIMLGFFSAMSNLLSQDGIEKAIENSVREKWLPLNRKAFSTGYEYGLSNYHTPTTPLTKSIEKDIVRGEGNKEPSA
jgi:2-oxoglutarate ferredoxin oxidoreductase subunit gamma